MSALVLIPDLSKVICTQAEVKDSLFELPIVVGWYCYLWITHCILSLSNSLSLTHTPTLFSVLLHYNILLFILSAFYYTLFFLPPLKPHVVSSTLNHLLQGHLTDIWTIQPLHECIYNRWQRQTCITSGLAGGRSWGCSCQAGSQPLLNLMWCGCMCTFLQVWRKVIWVYLLFYSHKEHLIDLDVLEGNFQRIWFGRSSSRWHQKSVNAVYWMGFKLTLQNWINTLF